MEKKVYYHNKRSKNLWKAELSDHYKVTNLTSGKTYYMWGDTLRDKLKSNNIEQIEQEMAEILYGKEDQEIK